MLSLNSSIRGGSFLAVGLLSVSVIQGDPSRAKKSPPARSDTMFREDVEIRGVFEGVLPQTQDKYTFKLLVNPHFGDFHRKSYLRAPLGLRYGLTDNWDVSAELEGYFSHGLDNVAAFEEWGLSEMHLTTKYRSNWSPLPGWDMAVRLRYTRPLDHPPLELTDGLEHILPAVTFAREVENWPGAEVFWSAGLDLTRETTTRGMLDDNEFGEDANLFTGGMVWRRDRRIYTFEATYATSSLIGRTDQHRIRLRPGVIFDLPRRFSFNSSGDWRVGVALKYVHGPDGPDFGLSVKFRGSFDLKRRRARVRELDLRR